MPLVPVPPAPGPGVVGQLRGGQDVFGVRQVRVVDAVGVHPDGGLVLRHPDGQPVVPGGQLDEPALLPVGHGQHGHALAALHGGGSHAVVRDELTQGLNGLPGGGAPLQQQPQGVVRLQQGALCGDRPKGAGAAARRRYPPVVEATGPGLVQGADGVGAGGEDIAAGLRRLGDAPAVHQGILRPGGVGPPGDVDENAGHAVPVVVGRQEGAARGGGLPPRDQTGTHRLVSLCLSRWEYDVFPDAKQGTIPG